MVALLLPLKYTFCARHLISKSARLEDSVRPGDFTCGLVLERELAENLMLQKKIEDSIDFS
jgi:hypothetical protein